VPHAKAVDVDTTRFHVMHPSPHSVARRFRAGATEVAAPYGSDLRHHTVDEGDQ